MSGAGDTAEMESALKDLPGSYDTSGIEQNFAQLGQMNTSRGLAMTNAMSRAAQGRAQRNGGSVAASFAGGAAMLPIIRQNAEMANQSGQMRLQAAMAQAQARAGLATGLASARQGQRGLMSNFYNEGLGRQQQGEQFDKNLGFQEKSLAQNQSQFDSDLGFRGKQLAQQGSQFDQSFGLDKSGQAFQRAMQALQIMPSGNIPYQTFGMGSSPMTSTDATAMQTNTSRNYRRQAVINKIQSLI